MLVVVAVAGFLIGFSKAGVGGTLGPFVTVLVALSIPADDAIGLLLPMLIFADLFTITAHWNQWVTPIVLRLLGAAIVGIAIGGTILTTISEATLRNLIAIAMLGFVAIYIGTRLRVGRENTLRTAWPAGLLAGLTSSIAHLGGPPISAYLLTTDLSPRRFVATSAALFTAVNLLKVPAYLIADLFDGGLISDTWFVWLTIPAGVFVGRRVVEHMNREFFDRITTALLVAGAIVLLVT